MRVSRGGAVVAVILLLGAGTAAATPSEVANVISSEIMSPFCDGVTLHECPSAEAVALRARIERWARRGWTRDRIMERLVREYGPSISALPPRSGTGALAWLAPGVAIVAGGAVAWARARRWSARSLRQPAAPISAAERGRLDDELAALRAGGEPGARSS